MSLWDEVEDIGAHAGDAAAWGWAWFKDTVTGSDENVTKFVNDQLRDAGYDAERFGQVGGSVAVADNPGDWTEEGWREAGNEVGRQVAEGAKEVKKKLDTFMEVLPWVVGGGIGLGVVVLAVIYLPRPRG